MGRFYKTAAQTPVDYMYELPKELMMGAIQNVDKQVGKTEADTLALNDMLKLQALSKDSEYAKQKLAEYGSQIENYTKQIHADPMAFRKQTAGIRDLSRTIKEDFTTGDAAKIQGAYDTRQANQKTLEEMWTKNPDKYKYEDIGKLMAINDAKYGGFKQGYQQNMLKEFVDINKEYEELAKGYEPEVLKKHGAYKGSDGYLYTSVDNKKIVDPRLILQDLTNAMMQDEKLNGYYTQQKELGNISEKGIDILYATTASRLANKYGYKDIEQGRTSIKNDDKDTAAFVDSLANPVSNVSPGAMYNESIIDKYNAAAAAEGKPLIGNTVAGIGQLHSVIQEQKNAVVNGLIAQVKTNGIQLSTAQQAAILRGDFSSLVTAKNGSDESMKPEVIAAEQEKYRKYTFDQNILEKQKAKAIASGNPDKYLSQNKGSGILYTDAKIQELKIVKKGQEAEFKKDYKDWKTGFKNSPNVWHTPLKFDAEQIKGLTQVIEYKTNLGNTRKIRLKDALKDGVTLQQLANNNILVAKEVKVGEELGEVSGQMAPVYQRSNEYANFSLNAENLMPTMNLDANGNAMAQFSITINGQPINTYVSESTFSNQSITRTLDKDRMQAANMINTADISGVIDDKPYDIEGLQFTRTSTGIMANGVYTTEDAIETIANKIKQDRENLNR